MKKIKYIVSIFALLLFISLSDNVYAKDVTSNFKITDFVICKNTKCTSIYADGEKLRNNSLAIKFEWEYSSDEPIEAGDEVTIPFANMAQTETTQSFGGGTLVLSDFYDLYGENIGKWEIKGTGTARKLHIIFDETAVGKKEIKGIAATLPNFSITPKYVETTIPVTVGNLTKNFLINKVTYAVSPDGFTYATTGGNNTCVPWRYRTPIDTLKYIYQYDKFNEIPLSDIYEELIAEYVYPPDVEVRSIYPQIRMPHITNLEEHQASNTGVEYTITNRFTKITQNEGESYADFKARITPLTYGIYTDENGTKTYVINFGSQPSDTLKYDEVLGKSVTDYFGQNVFTVDNDVKSIYDKIYNDDNLVRNYASYYVLHMDVYYPQVSMNTKVNNSVTWTWKKADGTSGETQVEISETLYAPVVLTAPKGVSKLILVDKTSKLPISGAKFKLYKFSEENNNWEIVPDADNLVTGTDGSIQVKDLFVGRYKYVQDSYLDHYIDDSYKVYSDTEFENEVTEFELGETGNVSYATNERVGYTITYEPGDHGSDRKVYSDVKYGDVTPSYTPTSSDGWTFKEWTPTKSASVISDATYTATWEKKVDVVAHHYLEGTTTKLADDAKVIKLVGANYTTTPSRNVASKYELSRVVGNESGTVTEDGVEVTYYYKLKNAKVITKHVDENGTVLERQTEEDKKYDDEYTTKRSTGLKNYDVTKTEGDSVSGVVAKDEVIVTYVYKKKNSKVTEDLKTTSTAIIEDEDQVINTKIKYDADIEDYIGDATVKIVYQLPYPIDEEKSDLDGGVYDPETQTITWTEQVKDIDTFDEDESGKVTIEKNPKIVYKDVDGNDRIVPGIASATLSLSDDDSYTSTPIENHDNLLIRIEGTIVVDYIDKNTNKIIKQKKYTNLVGKEYSTEAIDIKGYKLSSKPQTEVYKVTEEEQHVVYLYERQEVKGAHENPKTGDNVMKYVILTVGSMMLIVGCLIFKRKFNNEKSR